MGAKTMVNKINAMSVDTIVHLGGEELARGRYLKVPEILAAREAIGLHMEGSSSTYHEDCDQCLQLWKAFLDAIEKWIEAGKPMPLSPPR